MELNRFGTPSLITRTTNDVQQVQMVVLMALTMMVMAPIMCVGGIFMALRMNGRLSLSLVVILPVMTGLIALIVCAGACRCSAPCRSRSTGSTGCCGRPSPASGSSGPSTAPTTTSERFAEANADLTDVACGSPACSPC